MLKLYYKFNFATEPESLYLEGFNTIVAYNGRDVLKQIDDKIDLIILDIKMPYIDGFEVAQSLKDSNFIISNSFFVISIVMLFTSILYVS